MRHQMSHQIVALDREYFWDYVRCMYRGLPRMNKEEMEKSVKLRESIFWLLCFYPFVAFHGKPTELYHKGANLIRNPPTLIEVTVEFDPSSIPYKAYLKFMFSLSVRSSSARLVSGGPYTRSRLAFSLPRCQRPNAATRTTAAMQTTHEMKPPV